MTANETWETDGSPLAESVSLKWRLGQALEDNRALRAQLDAGTAELDRVIGRASPGSPLDRALREIRLYLTKGQKLTGTERADRVVEEWLQDPGRNVFGLAADLLDAISLGGR